MYALGAPRPARGTRRPGSAGRRRLGGRAHPPSKGRGRAAAFDFTSPSGLAESQRLAHMLDSLVRVSRRAGRVPEAEASPTGVAADTRPRRPAADSGTVRTADAGSAGPVAAAARAGRGRPSGRCRACVRYRRGVQAGTPGARTEGRLAPSAARTSPGAVGRRPTGRDVRSRGEVRSSAAGVLPGAGLERRPRGRAPAFAGAGSRRRLAPRGPARVRA